MYCFPIPCRVFFNDSQTINVLSKDFHYLLKPRITAWTKLMPPLNSTSTDAKCSWCDSVTFLQIMSGTHL